MTPTRGVSLSELLLFPGKLKPATPLLYGVRPFELLSHSHAFMTTSTTSIFAR